MLFAGHNLPVLTAANCQDYGKVFHLHDEASPWGLLKEPLVLHMSRLYSVYAAAGYLILYYRMEKRILHMPRFYSVYAAAGDWYFATEWRKEMPRSNANIGERGNFPGKAGILPSFCQRTRFFFSPRFVPRKVEGVLEASP